VTESWDVSEDKQRLFLATDKVAAATADSMTKSLARLADAVTA
jgi:hypothetical protein